MEKLFPDHNFKWIKHGQTAKGFCPFHADKRNRSLSIYLDSSGKQRWHCFACKLGNTEADAVKYAKGTNKDAANRWLVAHGYMQESELDYKARIKHETMQAFLEYSKKLLMEDARAAGIRAYIAGRNVKKAILEQSPLGFYPTVEEVQVWLEENAVPEELHREFLPTRRGYEVAEKSIAFFYKSGYGQWYRIKLRNPLIEEEEGGDKAILYLGKTQDFKGYFSASVDDAQSEHAIVVEGEFDVLALFSMCRDHDPECVEPIYCFGSGTHMNDGIQILVNAGIENIYAFPDNDGPGLQYAFDVADGHPHTFVMFPEDYQEKDDPADWARAHTFDELQVAFRKRIPAFEWIGKKLAKEYENGSVEDQSHAKEKVIQYAKKLSPSNREIFLKSYAPLTGASYESLWEEIQAADRIKYRKVLSTGADFGIHMGVPRGKKGIEWEHISNVIVEHEKDMVLDDGDGEEHEKKDRLFVLRISMVDKEKLITVDINEWNDDKTFMAILWREFGSDVWVKPKTVMYLRESAGSIANGKPKGEEMIYTHTGWHDGKFLMPNGYIDAEGWHDGADMHVELPPNPPMFRQYKTAPPPADMGVTRDIILNDILQVFPYEVTLPIIAHMFLGPLIEFTRANPYCLWIQGLTGSYKTSYAALLNCFWGDFVRGNAIETFRSTGNALEKNGFYLKDVNYIIDDYKKVDISDKYVTTLLQNYGNRLSRSRLRSDTNQQKNWNIRGLLTVTAEDAPSGESSVIARTLIVPIRSGGDCDKLTRGQLHAKHLPGVMAKYIQYVANLRLDELEVLAFIREKQKLFGKVHNRITENLALNSYAFMHFAKFMGCEDLIPVHDKVVQDIAKYMDHCSRSEQAGTMYVELLRDLLSGGSCYLEGTKNNNDLPSPHPENAMKLGWYDGEYCNVLSTLALAKVNELRTKIYGSPIKYSPQAIYEQLQTNGWITVPNGKSDVRTVVYRADAQSHRVLRFNKGVLDDYDTIDVKPQPEIDPIRFEENGAILN